MNNLNRPFKALVVGGNGAIGKAFCKLLVEMGGTATPFTSRDSRDSFLAKAAQHDIVVIAMSTKDKGEAELWFILQAFSIGVPVVTCAKGALAYHFATLAQHLPSHLHRFGFTATVGGASNMLALLRPPQFGISRISGILNGTTNFLFDWVASRIRLHSQPHSLQSVREEAEKAIAEAVAINLCEPGSKSLTDIFHAEQRDQILKASIIFNYSGISEEFVSPDDFSYSLVSEDEILRALRSGKNRPIVRIKKVDRSLRDFFPGFFVRKGSWQISGDCSPPENGETSGNDEFDGYLPPAAHNILAVEDYGGRKIAHGPGAGVIPTSATMLTDCRRLLEK